MKILMPVLHYYPVIGGLENWTQNIAERLAGKAEIFVVTSRVGDQLKEEVKNGVNIFRTSLINLKDLSYSSPVFILGALPFIFLKSLSLILTRKINLLHCQGFLGACLGYCLSRITGLPYIVTVQRMEESGFFKKLVYRKAKICIAASFAIKKYFEEIGCKNIEVIPNGVDLERFVSLREISQRDKSLEGFIVMAVARLEKVKGIEYLIRAMTDLKLSAVSCQLLVIGDGSERKNLENLVKKLGLEEKIKFVGQIPPEGIPEYLAMADCFVLPSLKEGFGITILEAMAARVPVIAARVGGILDIVKDQKTGILVEPRNPEAIARAILNIYNHPELKNNLVNSAIAELTRYDWTNIVERVYLLYENTAKTKVVLATGIYPPDIGGPATYTKKLANELSERDFDVEVITYVEKENSKFKIQNSKLQFKIQKVLKSYPKGLRHLLYFWKLLWLTRHTDVIYAQNVTSAGLPALLAAKLLKKRFILKVVGDAAWEQKKNYLKIIQNYVAKNANSIIVPSNFVKKMVIDWGAKEHKIKIIYNAVDQAYLIDPSKADAKIKTGIDGDIIISVGRLASWKGFPSLIEIMPDLIQENPDFRLLIVGEGEEKKNLESRIDSLGLSDKVKLLGKVEHSEMPFYLKASDIFVLNSGYEGLSHVILEAMQSGVPVIASNEGGNPELIEDGFNGFLVEYNNKEQLKSAILKLWQDKNLQEKFVKNSYERLKDFTWDNLVEKTLKVLSIA